MMKCTDLLFTFIMRCGTLNHRFLANQNTVMTWLWLGTWLDKLGITIMMRLLQKTALLGTARILRKGVGKVKEKDMAPSLGVMLV